MFKKIICENNLSKCKIKSIVQGNGKRFSKLCLWFSMNKTSVYKWYQCFQDGYKYITDDKSSRRPSTLTTDDDVENVRYDNDNRGIKIRDINDDVGISFGTYQTIFLCVFSSSSGMVLD